MDSLREIINIGVGRAAAVLHKMFGSHIKLFVPFVNVIPSDDLYKHITHDQNEIISSVKMSFNGEFSGFAKVMFPTESAVKLVSAFAEEDIEEDMDEVKSATLTEIGNILLNSLMGTIANLLELRINYAIPSYGEKKIEKMFKFDNFILDNMSVIGMTRFMIENLDISGDFVILFRIGSFEKFIDMVNTFGEIGEDAE
jgi:chemotaxis protein CheC